MWILAIVKVLCLMPNFETIKYFEGLFIPWLNFLECEASSENEILT